jgi:hypothetical protein
VGIEYIDAFDYNQQIDITQRYDKVSGNYNAGISYGRNDSGLILSNGYVQRDIGVPRTHWVVGIALRIISHPLSSLPFLTWIYSTNNNAQAHITINSSRKLEARRGGVGGPLLGSSTTPLDLNVWYYVEWELNIDDTFGISKIWLNNQVVLNLQLVDTKTINELTADTLRIGYQNNNSFYNFVWHLDDLYVKSIITPEPDPHLGNCKIKTIKPTSDAGPNTWTVSGAVNHFDAVDQVPNDNTDYITTTTNGVIDVFGMQDLSLATNDQIFAIQTNIVAKGDSTSEQIRTKLKINSTLYDGFVQPITSTTDYKGYTQTFETNPETNVVWTSNNVDDTDFGVEYVT